jgi:hypothetical protein
MEQGMSKRIIYFILITFLCCSCVNKKMQENEIINENEFNDNNEIVEELDASSVNNIVYVASFYGMTLLSEPDIYSKIIKLLPQNTKLVVYEKSEGIEEINGFNDYWYMVYTGHETGWIFGAYLFHKPITNKIRNLQLSKMLEEDERIKSPDNKWIVNIEGAIFYNNRDTLTVYNKGSGSFLTDYKNIFLIRMDGTPDWFYLISDDYEIQGYIYIYSISEKSFYGDLDKMKRSGNYYESLLNAEYEIIRQHKNIKRYGPLITIEHGGKVTELWDTIYGLSGGIKYLLLDYFPEYNEILIIEQYREGSYNFIYNLEFDEYRCERIDEPYFNNPRTYLITMAFGENIGDYILKDIKIYKISNGYYEKIYEQSSIHINREWHSNETIRWINDNKVCIDYGKAGSIIFNIGNEISVEDTLAFVVRPDW